MHRNDLIKQKIKEGVDVNSSVKNGTTLLMFACKYNHIDTVKLLLELGADINRHKKTEYSYSPLMHDCDKEYKDYIDVLSIMIKLNKKLEQEIIF